MFIKAKPNQRWTGPIIPKEVSVFYEDGMPYLRYVGTTSINYKDAKICFPKIGLTFDQLQAQCDEMSLYDTVIGKNLGDIEYGQRLYPKDSQYFKYEILPQEVTLDELEKMLGYPVVIKEKK